MPTLDYASPRSAGRGEWWDGGAIIAASIAFAVGHWVTEYGTGYLLIVQNNVLGLRPWKVRDHFIDDMITESLYAFCELFVIGIGLSVYRGIRFGRITRIRRGGWLVALLAGAVYSLIRWGIWWAHFRVPFTYDDLSDVLVGLILTVGASAIIGQWRWGGHTTPASS